MLNEDNMIEEFNWDVFLQPYELAVNGFIIKLEAMKKQYILREAKNPIESIMGRIKTPTSILEKAKRMNVSFSDIPESIQDIGGIRIICKYVQDVYGILDLLQSRKDMKIILIKDYIKNPKPSGYRSLHIIARHNVETIDGQKQIYLEFQVRTLAMHLWASIEHSLKYKYYQNIPEQIKKKLQQAAEITMDLDEKITKIQNEVDSLDDTPTRKEYELEWEEHMIKKRKYMIYALFGEYEFKDVVEKKLDERGHNRNDESPEYVFSIGGDGTILKAIKRYQKQLEEIKFVGINLGRLGFYTSYEKKELDDAIEAIETGKYEIANYNLLEYLLKAKSMYKSGFGLNEIVIIDPIHTQIIDVFINDKYFETFRGTGFLAATPTGSTAYNKSLGGSVIDPNICALQLTEIASINNRVYKTLGSSLVLSQETLIKLKSNFHNAYVTVDGMYEHFNDIDEIIIRLSSRTAKFIIKHETDFWDRVKRSFLD